MLKNEIVELIDTIYTARKERKTRPSGGFEGKYGSRLWHPSEEEDCGGSGTSVCPPTQTFQWSYMLHCRTRKHCKNLVAAAMKGKKVPRDVAEALAAARAASADGRTQAAERRKNAAKVRSIRKAKPQRRYDLAA